MRNTILILLISTFQIFAAGSYAQTKKLNLDMKNTTIKEVLSAIEDQSEFYFLYNSELIDVAKKVDVEIEGEKVDAILARLFSKEKVDFLIKDRYIVLTPVGGNAELFAEQQQPAISGTVTDESGEPLPGVTVVVKGTTQGTVTNADGNYSLTNIPEDATLVFSFVGMRTQEVEVGNQTTIDVTMAVDAIGIEEVVAIGYGTMKKRDLTGAVTSVKSQAIEEQGHKTNILETVTGLTPGMNFSLNTNTAEQESFNVIVRGRNSITASNTPLIIVDGVPFVGGLNEINQNDIESIDILKDASSIAIYGARGSNGVIIITTKTGDIGAPKIGYDGSYGVKEIYNVPPLMNGQEHWDYTVERYSEEVAASYPTRLQNYQEGNSTDWVDLATRIGQQMRHNLKLQGGSEFVRYFLSGTYTDVEGIAVGDDFTQYTFRTNLSFNVTDWLEIGTNSQYVYQDLSGLSANFNQAFFLIPLINAYESDGSIALYPWPEEPVFQNPLSNLNVQDEHFKKNLFSNNYLKIDFPFISGLSYELNTGFTFTDNQIGRFWGDNTVVGNENNGQAYTQNILKKDQLIENLLVYDKSWQNHNLSVTALYSYQTYVEEGRSLTTRGFPTLVLTWYQHDVASVLNPNSSYFEQNYISQMGRINYNYNSRYLLTLTLRRDGYSGFGKDNKFGTFPSIAAGWNVADEPFMSDLTWLDQLKLRASYGKNGNQAISPYQTLASLNQLNYLTGESATATAPGYYPGGLASPSLGWETSKSLNIGIDMVFLDGKFRSSVDYYNTNTYDLLLNRSISPVHGITSITQNIGETKNKGVELSIASENVNTGAFKWTTNFNLAHNKNEIVDLYGNMEDDVANGWFIGKSIDANYDYVFDGVWQIGDDIENSPQPEAQPGDVKVKNTNGDDKIDPDDRDFMGQTNPKFIAGLTNTVEFKNLMFSFIFYTKQGMTRVNPLWDTDLVWADVRRNSILLNNWSEDNPTNEYPANRDGTNPYEVRFYQDASFVRLRDVTLSYSFDESLVSRLGLSQARLYFNINNALTFTKWEGLDPELAGQRSIPLDRTYSLGLNFSF